LAKTLEECFRFDSAKGLVNAKSKKKINLTFKPNQRYDFNTKLQCEALEKMPKEVSNALAKQPKDKNTRLGPLIKSTIDIKCSGDFPLVRITDVRNSEVSIANLWERF
jgi:hypothetical protein